MDYRGIPIGGGGWLEIFLLTIPVAAYQIYRRVSKKEKFGISDIFDGAFMAYLTIGLYVFAAAFILMIAYFATAIIMLIWVFLSGSTIENAKEMAEFRYLLAAFWLVFAYKAFRYSREK